MDHYDSMWKNANPKRWSEMIYSEWSRKFIEQEIYGSYKFLCVFNVDRIVKKKKKFEKYLERKKYYRRMFIDCLKIREGKKYNIREKK